LKKVNDKEFRIKSSSIDSTGRAEVIFTKPLRRIQNISLIDSLVLDLSLVSGAYKNSIDFRDLNFTWKAESMTGSSLVIKMSFSSLEGISSLQVTSISNDILEL